MVGVEVEVIHGMFSKTKNVGRGEESRELQELVGQD